MSISYLGSYGRELPGFVDSNIAPATKTISYAVNGGPLGGRTMTMPLYTTRVNNSFGAMTDIFSGINSNYQALAVELNHRMTRHLQFSANYTWAHALDFVQNEATFTDTNDVFDPFNLRGEYGNSIYDVPNRFVFNAVAEVPWKLEGWKGALANGWELAPLFQVQSGLPYSITTSTATGAPPNGTGALLTGTINGSGGRNGLPIVQRNAFRMPNTQVMDLRASKHFTFHDRYGVELIGETFNLFNHLNATSVNTLGYTTGGTSAAPTLNFNAGTGTSAFGAMTNANSNFAYSTRQVQLAARFTF